MGKKVNLMVIYSISDFHYFLPFYKHKKIKEVRKRRRKGLKRKTQITMIKRK